MCKQSDQSIRGSITLLISELNTGKADALQKVFDFYHQRLSVLARKKLGAKYGRVVDGEDLAIEVLTKLFADMQEDKILNIQSRHDLWRMLAKRIDQIASNQRRDQSRKKRGGGRVVGESIFRTPQGAFDQVGINNEPEAICSIIQEMHYELLDTLSNPLHLKIMKSLLVGETVDSIAVNIKRSRATVYRKLGEIRTIWEQYYT